MGVSDFDFAPGPLSVSLSLSLSTLPAFYSYSALLVPARAGASPNKVRHLDKETYRTVDPRYHVWESIAHWTAV